MDLGPLGADPTYNEPPEMICARMEALERRIVELEDLGEKAQGDKDYAYLKSLEDEATRAWRQIENLAVVGGNEGAMLVCAMIDRQRKRATIRTEALHAGKRTTPSSTKPTPKTVPVSSSPSASPKPSSVVLFPHGMVPRRRRVAYGIVVVSVLAPTILGLLVGISLIVVSICATIQLSVMSAVVELGLASRRQRQEAPIALHAEAVTAPTYRQTLGTTYFEPYTDCPKCGTEALHWIDTPAFDSEFDDFDVVRTCRAENDEGKPCGHRWGQNALGIAPSAPIQGCIDPKTIGKITLEAGTTGETAEYHCRCALCCKAIDWTGTKPPAYLPYCSSQCWGQVNQGKTKQEAWADFRQNRREEAIRDAFDGVRTQDATDTYNALLALPSTPPTWWDVPVSPSGCRPCDEQRLNHDRDDDARLYF